MAGAWNSKVVIVQIELQPLTHLRCWSKSEIQHTKKVAGTKGHQLFAEHPPLLIRNPTGALQV
jgi:hypothetical protein